MHHELLNARRRRLAPCLAVWAALALGLLVAAPAQATVESELAFHRGVVAFGESRYDEARTLFETVAELDPSDTVALHYLVLIAQKQGDTERALQLAEKGLALDPEDPDLRIDLGVIQLESGRSAEARASFERVVAAQPDNARAHLFAGIAAYRMGAYSEALPHLDRAIALDPSLSVQARYYAGLAEAFLGNLPGASGAFADVEQQSPQHPLAQSAQQLRDQIQLPEPERPWTLSLTAGGEYDSNPLVAGQTIPRDDDYRGVWRARGSYDVYRNGGFSLNAGAEGYWSIHHQQDEVDLQTYVGFANMGYQLGPVLFGLDYDFVYTFTDFDDPFRLLNRVTPSLSVVQGDIGLTQIYYQFQQFNFLQSPLTGQLDRDGFEHFVGVSQYFFLPAPISYVRFGALGDFVDTEGSEYQFDGYELFVGTSIALPWSMQFETIYRYADRDFDQADFFPPNDVRDESIHHVGLELIKTINEHIDVAIAGSLGFRDSNIPVYDYNRYVAGAYVTYRF